MGLSIGNLAEATVGHALNAGNNLLNYGSLHAPTNVPQSQLAAGTGYNSLGSELIKSAGGEPGQNTSQAASGSGGNNVVTTAQPNTNVNSGVYNGSGSTAAANAANIAAYQDQNTALNQLLQNADVNLGTGQNSINTGFNNAMAQLQGNNQNVLNGYQQQNQQTTQGYNQALNTINANARNGYNSLEALLGGTGSAGDVLAPFAVSNAANQQRGASSQAFAQNQQAIQNGINAANLNYKNQANTLLGQKNTQLQNLLDSINQQKIQYEQQLAANNNQINVLQGGNAQPQSQINNNINDLLQQQQAAAAQYAQPQFTVSDYTAPTTNLADYQSQAAQLAGNGSTDTSATDPTGALTNLLKSTQAQNSYAY